MPRKESETVPEGNGPTPEDAYKTVTWKELRRVVSETWGEAFRECEYLRRMDQRLASLDQNARQPRLAMDANVPADEKTRERTDDAAKAVQAMHNRDSFSAKKVQDDPKSSTTFGMKAEPPALSCRDDVLVENGAAAPKLCLSPLEMRTWLTPHRQNLYSDEDPLRPAKYLFFPDRRDKFEDFNSRRLVL